MATVLSSAVIAAEPRDVFGLLRRVNLRHYFPGVVATSQPGPTASTPPLAVGATRTGALVADDNARVQVRLTSLANDVSSVAFRLIAADAACPSTLAMDRTDVMQVRAVKFDVAKDDPSNESIKSTSALVEWKTTLPTAASDATALRSALAREHADGFREFRRLLGVGPSVRVRMFDAGLSAEYDAWRADGPPNTAEECGDADAEADTRMASVLDVSTNTWVATPWSSVRRGDIVRVCSGEESPADLFLLWCTSPVQTPVSMKNFDGVDGLRLRKPLACPAFDRPMPSADDAADGGGADNAGGDANMDAMAIQCPVCTMYNPTMVTECTMCGSPLGGGGGGAKTPLELLGQGPDSAGGSASEVGNGSVFDVLRSLGEFTVPPPRVDSKFEAWFAPADGSEKVKTNHVQLVPRWGKLIFAEALVGMVVYTGRDTKWAMQGGAAQAIVVTAEEKRREKRDKALKAAAAARKAARLAMPVDPSILEDKTGIFWSNRFTNVPDDGNCGMHAFWLGLRTLLELYPHLKLPGEPELAASPVEFRLQALDRLEADAGYMSLVDAMLRLWLSLDASVLASSVEDFYTLPSTFQEQFMAANKQAHATGTESLDVAALCKAYVNMMREVHEVGEGSTRRPSYVPLGEIELSALCDLYKVRLQAIKSEDITVSSKHGKKGSSSQDVKGPTLDTIDPRCVRPEHVLDRFAPKDAKRYVRVLNVDTNHYQVHLPRAPPTTQ